MGGTRYDTTEIAVCTVCIHLLANGEYNDGTAAAQYAEAGMKRVWGDNVKHLVPGDGDLGFSWSTCEGCGENLGGDRHQAFVMIPIVSTD